MRSAGLAGEVEGISEGGELGAGGHSGREGVGGRGLEQFLNKQERVQGRFVKGECWGRAPSSKCAKRDFILFPLCYNSIRMVGSIRSLLEATVSARAYVRQRHHKLGQILAAPPRRFV